MTDNLVKFPNSDFQSFPTNVEESIEHLIMVRQDYCDEVCEDVMNAVTAVMSQYGFVVKSQENHIKDYVFLEEAVKAALYRYKRLDHGFHDIIDATISLTPEAAQELADRKEKELNI